MSPFFQDWRPRRLLWPLSLMVILMCASGKGQVELPFTFGLPDFDKIAHFGVFGLLTVGVARAGGSRAHGFGWSLAGMLWAVLYGLLDETLQGFNPHRSGFDVGDWLADVLGAVTAVFLWRGWAWGRHFLETPLRFRKSFQPPVPIPDPTLPPPGQRTEP